MNILINDEKIEYELESEKNLGEIINSLEKWVLQNGSIINSIIVDNKSVPIDYKSKDFEEDLLSITEIKISTLTNLDLALNTIKTIGEYIIKMLNEYLEDNAIKYNDQIIEGLKLITEGIKDSLNILKIKDRFVIDNLNTTKLDSAKSKQSLREILVKVDTFISSYKKRYIDGEGVTLLRLILNDLLNMIPKIFQWAIVKRFQDFKDIDNTTYCSFFRIIWKDILDISQDSLMKFENVGNNLQVGDDLIALEDIKYIADLLDEVIVLIKTTENIYNLDLNSISVYNKNANDIFHEIYLKLKDIEDAFSNEDMITVGDVMEYEVKSQFEILIDLIKEINDIIS